MKTKTLLPACFLLSMAAALAADPTARVIPKGEPASAEVAAPEEQPAAPAIDSHPAIKVARAYLSACAKVDADALNALFLDKGRATISENAGDEGSWDTYRDHHLLPELKEMPGFVMTVSREDVQTFGTTSVVRQTGSFAVPAPNHKDLPKKYLAAVTYVVVDEGDTPKIAHLHWSSRAEKKGDAAVPATPATGHGTTPDHDHK